MIRGFAVIAFSSRRQRSRWTPGTPGHLAAGKRHHLGIADPVRRRDDDLVAGIEGCHQRVVEHLLAGADDDLGSA
jgi:hypothetical protein